MNSDGTYTFESSTPGTYHYQVPVCVPDEPTPCPTTRLTITVLDNTDPTTNPPVANTDYGTVLSNSSIEVATLANDAAGYPEASLVPSTVVILTSPSNGDATVDPVTGNITYTPDPGFVGQDMLMYQVCDDSDPALCATAWQIITVTPEGGPNTTTAVDDYIFIETGSAGTGNVATNDSDPEGDSQSVTPQNTTIAGVGMFVLAANGDYTFTPEPGFSGPVDIVYTTCDDGDPQACASATLHVLVGGAVPDLVPTIDIDALNFTAASSARDFVVNIFEINNLQTTEPIVIRVTKLPAFSISYNSSSGVSDVFGGIMNENSNWDITENSGFITFTSKVGVFISGSGSAILGLTISPNMGTAPNTSQNITATIAGGSGGEIKIDNNRSIVTITQN